MFYFHASFWNFSLDRCPFYYKIDAAWIFVEYALQTILFLQEIGTQ